MKRILLFILIMVMLVCICGCSNKDADIANPVKVYYCQKNVEYTGSGIIVADTMDYSDWNGRMLAFLNFYISAPVKENMESPFPAGANINAIEYRDDTLRVQLNALFSRLSASELTVACACITLTLFELTDAYAVSFSYHNGSNETIAVMNRANLIFKDLSVNN